MIQDNHDANGDEYIKKTKELVFAWVTRGLLVFIASVGMPLGIWMLERIVATADDISASVHSHDTKLELLNQQGKEIKDLVSDHETRIRSLERGPTFAPR